MTDYLLTSESFVKDKTPIFDNINGKYILSAIREAQEGMLQSVIGTAVLERLKELCKRGDIETEAEGAYYLLLQKCQMATAYQAIAELAHITSYKITNKGVVKTSDDRVENATESEIIRTAKYYQNKADRYVGDLQRFLLANESKYPELHNAECANIRANLHSSATCGLWLGGYRGKKL